MKKLLAGLALAATLIGSGVVITAPAEAASISVRVGPTHHHRYYHRPYYRHAYRPYYRHAYYHRPYYRRPVVAIGVGPYFWHGRHYAHRYMCSRHWCYR